MDLWISEREKATILECGLKVLRGNLVNGRAHLLVWLPKAKNPLLNGSFKNLEEGEKYLAGMIKRFEDQQAKKMLWKLERQGVGVDIAQAVKVGDIFHYSWGYDQTNCDFFQVINLKNKTVTIREIASKHSDRESGNSMAAFVLPVKDNFTGEPMKKRLQFWSSKPYIRMASYGTASLWGGKECYSSWYA